MYTVYYYPLFGDPELIGAFDDVTAAYAACESHHAWEPGDDDGNEDSYHFFGPKGNEILDPFAAT